MANDFSADSNCVAEYRFEDGALDVDSKGSNTLTKVFKCDVDTSDYKQGAASIDRADNSDIYLDDADMSSDFPLKYGTTNKTISVTLWVKWDAAPVSADRIWAKAYWPDDKISLYVYARESFYNFRYVLGYNNGAAYEVLYTGSVAVSGRWYHIGFTYDDTDKSWKFVVWDDTAQSKVDNASGTAENNISLTEAEMAIGQEGTNLYEINAHFDEVVIFKDVLSTQEIDDIRQGNYPAGAPEAKPYWYYELMRKAG